MSGFVTHLEGAIDGAKLDPAQPHQLHAGRPILVRYDLDRVRESLKPADFLTRDQSLWRYRELLPVADDANIVTLGEGSSPLLRAHRLGSLLGLKNLLVKDESQLPTGSFKSRGQTTAMSMCKRFGIKRVALPTAGNAGGAAAAYAARAGIECFVFMPSDTPVINQIESAAAGAHVFLVDGLINDCGKIVGAGMKQMGWFDLSTLKEPYRVEGKKTMGIELAEQLGWKLPDVILYPTGGGTGLIGMWKAFAELCELGWLKSDKLPRMVSVQPDGCCPIVRAFESGSRFAEPFANAQTVASGLRVPVAVGDFLMLDAIRESNGIAVSVSDESIMHWMHRGIAAEGISFCPESAACIAAAYKLAGTGWIKPDENVVLFNCGAFQKYPHLMTPRLPTIPNPASIDWDWITSVASGDDPRKLPDHLKARRCSMSNASWSTKHDFKFSAGPWNIHSGADPFGPTVRDERTFADKLKVFKDLGFDYVQFHDDDAVPDDFSPADRQKKAREIKKLLDDHGLKAEICAPRHWEHSHGIDGPVTSNSAADRQWATERGLRCIDVAHELGTDRFVWWPAREGTYVRESKDATTSFNRMIDFLNAMLEYDKKIKILGEMKPNEPMDLMYLPTTGHFLALAYKSVDPSRVGVLIESAHAILAGLDPSDEMAYAMFHKKLWGVHLNDQNGLKYDQDKAFGAVDLRRAFNQVDVLVRNGYGKAGEVVGLDVKAMRTQKADKATLHLKHSKEIFLDLVDLVHSIDRNAWKSYVDARDYEGLERFIVKNLMGRR